MNVKHFESRVRAFKNDTVRMAYYAQIEFLVKRTISTLVVKDGEVITSLNPEVQKEIDKIEAKLQAYEFENYPDLMLESANGKWISREEQNEELAKLANQLLNNKQ